MLVESRDPRRVDRHHAGHPGPVEQAAAHHDVADDGQGGLEAEHAGRGVDERLLLVVPRVRRVVRGDRVDGPVGESLPQRADVLLGP